jgi:6-phosphogluconolactonase
MRSTFTKLVIGAASLALTSMFGCSNDTDGTSGPDPVVPGAPATPAPGGTTPAPTATTPATTPPPTPKPAASAVYTLSNEAASNAVVVYARSAEGALSARASFATGGKGSGSGLGDQGSLVYDKAQSHFLAVNAGDDSISMLALEEDGNLALLAKVASGGVKPISITYAGNIVYVLNAGDDTHAANISGFRITGKDLVAIAASTQPLSAAQPGPAQIQFTPDGKQLVVTEKGTNMIDTYAVTAGVAAAPRSQASAGMTPFGFAFSGANRLIVSEAFGGAENAGATSSYTLAADGKLSPITSSALSAQSAPCWVSVVANHAFVTNTKTNNVTAYTIATGGALTLLDASGESATTGATPIDVAASDDGFLYTLNAGAHSLSVFAIGADGHLTKKADVAGVPATAVGLVAR